jgi:hypothetical protein
MSDVAATPEPIVSITPFLVSIPTAADLIGRSVSFIYYAIADGKIAAVKSDTRTLVVVDSLRAYAASLPPAKIKPIYQPPQRLRRQKAK